MTDTQRIIEYLESSIAETERWMRRYSERGIRDRDDRNDLIKMTGELRSLERTLKYVKSIKNRKPKRGAK